MLVVKPARFGQTNLIRSNIKDFQSKKQHKIKRKTTISKSEKVRLLGSEVRDLVCFSFVFLFFLFVFLCCCNKIKISAGKGEVVKNNAPSSSSRVQIWDQDEIESLHYRTIQFISNISEPLSLSLSQHCSTTTRPLARKWSNMN